MTIKMVVKKQLHFVSIMVLLDKKKKAFEPHPNYQQIVLPIFLQ